jgi:hypothetical protein
MQLEMFNGGSALFFDLFVALCNHVDDISSARYGHCLLLCNKTAYTDSSTPLATLLAAIARLAAVATSRLCSSPSPFLPPLWLPVAIRLTLLTDQRYLDINTATDQKNSLSPIHAIYLLI